MVLRTQSTSISVYRVGAGVTTATLVLVQYWLTVRDSTDGALLVGSLRFFSFFTILTNLVAAVALLAPVLAARSALGRFLDRPRVRTAIAGYMIMVGAVYYLLLVGLSHRQDLTLYIEHGLHALTPTLFVLDWVLFVDGHALDWRIGLRGLAYPLIYLAWILAYGAVSDWYPYPFLDVADLGYARALVNAAALVTIYLLLELALMIAKQKFTMRAS